MKSRLVYRRSRSFILFLVYVTFVPAHPPAKQKEGVQKRKSGKSKKSSKHMRGVERKPLLNKSEFTPGCLADLAKHGFNPTEQRFLPDGRWTCETFGNGGRVKFTAFHVSFD